VAPSLKAVFFDVGETIVDEERYWRAAAREAGIGPHVLWAALGVTIARGEEHLGLWRHLGLARPQALDELVYTREDLYPDALECLEAVRAMGLLVGLAGNQNAALERWARAERLPVDVVLSSAGLGVRKPDPAFFARIVEESGAASAGDVVYVGDRVDNDVLPAAAAGLVAVHVRRGPWGRLQRTPPEAALAVDDLASLPQALASRG
jgi:HAD superfamily hydrolase (TIGR01509 family)